MAHVTIVGAGLAGLAAAVTVADEGHDVLVVDSADGIGGRVRTDVVEGHLLDRGFQIMLTAYPVARRMLDFDELDLRRFHAGALVQGHSGRALLGDPLRRTVDLVDTIRAPVGTPIDKARLLAWRRRVLDGSVDQLWKRGEVTTLARLRDRSFSDPFIEGFLRPLLAGISLDPKLDVTSRFSEFVFRMLAEGYGAIPARGMGEIPTQLALRLPDDSIRLYTEVVEVGPHHVEIAGGERIESDAVIVATDMDAAERLVGTPNLGWNGVTTRWYSADAAPYDEPLLLLNGTGAGPVNNVAVLSSISPQYAPAGRELIAVSTPGPVHDDVEPAVRRQLSEWFGAGVDSWELLRTDVIEQAQPRYLPGEALPAPVALESGVFVAGDHRQNPSINGALQSGRRAARSVLESLSSS